MRTKKNIVHRRHSIKRNVLDKIKSRSRKNNVKFNNTSKTKLRKRHFNFNNQSGGADKLNKFKKSNCKLSIEDISKDNCLYNLVVEAIYDTVEKFLEDEEVNKTRKELYNSIKESVIGVLMHFVKFRDKYGNLLVTNHSELDDILDFFTIFFIVKIYLSKEENTMRLRNFLEENFLTGNYASDLEMTQRELIALENLLKMQAGSFMSQKSVKSLISNISSGYGSVIIDGSNYDNFSSEGSQLYRPGSLYSGVSEVQIYDNADASISGTPVQVGVKNPLYGAISKEQNTYAEAGLVTKEKLAQMLEESKRNLEEIKASRQAFFKKLRKASESPTLAGNEPSTSRPNTENAYEELENSESQIAEMNRLIRLRQEDVSKVERIRSMYVDMSDSRHTTGANTPQSDKLLVVVTNPEQKKPNTYETLTPRDPAANGEKTPVTPAGTSAGPYDTLTSEEQEQAAQRELLEAAALYESTRINIDKIETWEQGVDLIRRHLKMAKTIDKIMLLKDKMDQLYKKFEFSTVQDVTGVSTVQEVSGVSSYYESADITGGVTREYEELDELKLSEIQTYEIPSVQIVRELGGEVVSATNEAPPPPVLASAINASSIPPLTPLTDEFKQKIIDGIDLDVHPSHFSVAVVYNPDVIRTDNIDNIESYISQITSALNEFIKTLPQELQSNENFITFKDGLIKKVIDNVHRVKGKTIIFKCINTLDYEFSKEFKATETLISFAHEYAQDAAEKTIHAEQQKGYEDFLKVYQSIITASNKLFQCFILLKKYKIKAIDHNEIGVSLFILFFMTVIHNIYVGGLKKYFRNGLQKFIHFLRNELREDLEGGLNGGGNRGDGPHTKKEEKSPKLELNLDSNVIRMLKEYVSVYAELDSDNKNLAGNFTNIIPILISRSMKGGFISPFIRNFKNAIKKRSVTSLNPSDFNLVNHIFFIKKEKRPFKYDNESPQQVDSESAMTTYTFGSNLQNTFGITALGTIKTGKMITSPIKPKQSLSDKYFIEAPNNSNIKTRILGSNYTKQTIKTSNNFIELLKIKMDELIKGGIVSNFHSALETSNELKVEELHSYSYRLYSEQDLSEAVPDTSLYAQTQIVSELFNALKHSVVNK